MRRRHDGSGAREPDPCAAAAGRQSSPFMPAAVAITRDNLFVYVLGGAIAARKRVGRGS
jgi:hypothetical protein